MNKKQSNFSKFVDNQFMLWLKENRLEYKEIKHNGIEHKNSNPFLILIYCNKYCIKLYDCFGHGSYSFTSNIAIKYDESIYEGDFVSIDWVFKYFKIKSISSFLKRTKEEYIENVPIFISEMKLLVNKFNNIENINWLDINEFARIQLKKAGLI